MVRVSGGRYIAVVLGHVLVSLGLVLRDIGKLNL